MKLQPKAVRQRQLSFFLLANENHTPFPLRESQNPVATMASTPAPWLFGTGDHLSPGARSEDVWAQTGLALLVCHGNTDQHQPWSTAKQDRLLRSGAWGEERKHNWLRPDHCSEVPTASLTSKGSGEEARCSGASQAYVPTATCKAPVTSCPCFPAMFQLGSRLTTKQNGPCTVTTVTARRLARAAGRRAPWRLFSPALMWPTDTACRDR